MPAPNRLTYLGLTGSCHTLPACVSTFSALKVINASSNYDVSLFHPLECLEHLADLGASL